VPSDGDLGFTSSNPYSPPPTQNGTISTGGGSGSAYAPYVPFLTNPYQVSVLTTNGFVIIINSYVVTPLEAISLRARHTSMTVDYELNQDSDLYRYVDVVVRTATCLVLFRLF